MSDREANHITLDGVRFLAFHSSLIATLPLEDWLAQLNLAEAVSPKPDPTIVDEYLYSEKAKLLKELLVAAIPLMQAVHRLKPIVAKLMDEEQKAQVPA